MRSFHNGMGHVTGTRFYVSTYVVFLFLMTFIPGCGDAGRDVHLNPRIATLRQSEAVITWVATSSDIGTVVVRPVDGGDEIEVIDPVASTTHEVVIKGLEPGRRYSYRIEGAPGRYTFQTEPLPETRFSVLIVRAGDAPAIGSAYLAAMPDLVFDITQTAATDFDSVRSGVPVIGTDQVRTSWAGFTWVTVSGRSTEVQVEDALNTSGHYGFGMILVGAAPDYLEALLRRHPSVKFLVATAEIKGLAIPMVTFGPKDLAMRLDVDPDFAQAVSWPENRKTVLIASKSPTKRTCVECRRLADKGSYEQSVKAFETFIEDNQGHYQIDDAYFAIATILDEKLFRFRDALAWYKKLAAAFPDSSLAPFD